jgi:NAD(P)-dependent dehydrogenase (short-subunit alcohol dehydrogenase family)
MKTILITGANKGIGYGLAKKLATQNNELIITSRSLERAKAAKNTLSTLGSGKIWAYELDLLRTESIEHFIQQITANHPTVDLLINNAGIPGGRVQGIDAKLMELQAAIQVNLTGTFQVTQGLLPILAHNRGRIINNTVPTNPNKFWNPMIYKATKAAQNVMMESLNIEFEQNNIPVEIYSIHPGPTTTDLNGNMTAPGFHTIDEVAEKFSHILTDGQNHAGELVEIYPTLGA